MPGVYSVRFCSARSQQNVEFKVPAGHVAVVRNVTAFNRNAQPQPYDVRISYGPTYVCGGFLAGSGATGTRQYSDTWDLRVVVREGESIFADAGQDVDMVVSGYLLVA